MGNANSNNHDHSSKGMWQPIKYRFKYLPVHIALLHTGKVLAFGGSGNDERYLKNPHPAEIFEPDVDSDIGDGSDHKEGRVYEISSANIDADIFCAGHTFLPDGRLLVAGGTYKYDGTFFRIPIPPFSGLEHSYIFDPVGLKWSRIANMSYGRWYPTCILLSDGRVLIMAGLTKRFPWAFLNKLEIYSKDKGWQRLRGTHRWIPMYPRLHLLPSGEVFYAGSYNTHYTFPFSLRSFPSATYNVRNDKWTTIGLPGNIKREEGTSVILPLLPPDYTARVVLIAGGLQPGTEAINHVEMIDFSDSPPHYKPRASLSHARYYCYAVLLPDQQVLVLGGKMGTKSHHISHDDSQKKRQNKKAKFEHVQEYGYDISDNHNHENHDYVVPQDPLAVKEPELYNVEEDKWYRMAHMKLDRLYHANAILLPDGRVMAAGSNPKRGVNELHIELFCPPYLFRGNRPKISRHPGYISYGHEFEIETDVANEIQAVALMRPSVNTHCVDTEQRYVGLSFSHKNPDKLVAKVPSNRNVAPPGYYMLFIIKENNIPSVAPFVLLN